MRFLKNSHFQNTSRLNFEKIILDERFWISSFFFKKNRFFLQKTRILSILKQSKPEIINSCFFKLSSIFCESLQTLSRPSCFLNELARREKKVIFIQLFCLCVQGDPDALFRNFFHQCTNCLGSSCHKRLKVGQQLQDFDKNREH